jgi:hypothetical protein
MPWESEAGQLGGCVPGRLFLELSSPVDHTVLEVDAKVSTRAVGGGMDIQLRFVAVQSTRTSFAAKPGALLATVEHEGGKSKVLRFGPAMRSRTGKAWLPALGRD